MREPEVTIVTPNQNGRRHLEVFLDSVEVQDVDAPFEVIVVDNGSTDGSLELLRARPRVRVLQNAENVGFARSNNQAAAVARGRYLALLNNDVRLEPTWLRTMLAAADTAPDDSPCFASRLLTWDGAAIDFADAAMSFNGIGYHPWRGDPAAAAPDVDEILFASGAAMLIRRDVFVELGGFDEAYFNYYEDVDLGWRLWVCGHRVRLCRGAVAYHRRNATIGPWDETTRLLERNAIYSVVKNYDDASLRTFLPAALFLAARRAEARRRAEKRGPWWPPRRNVRTHDASAATTTAVAEAFANLPEVVAKRRGVQALRRRSDAEVVGLFRWPLGPENILASGDAHEALRALGVIDRLDSLLAGAGGLRK
jgi:GT2 family glycosyltransferase